MEGLLVLLVVILLIATDEAKNKEVSNSVCILAKCNIVVVQEGEDEPKE